MKYNPLTNELLADDGMLLKKLHCPIAQQWDTMPEARLIYKVCDHCTRPVHDTALLTEDEVKALISNDAHTCFKIDLNQNNLTVTYHE
jgi:hypothetical protein